MKKHIFALFIALSMVLSCAGIQINQNAELASIQSVAAITGYKVGKNNQHLIDPISVQAQALLEATKGEPGVIQSLIKQSVPLLLSVVNDPAAQAAITGLVAMVEVKEDIQAKAENMAKIQVALKGFINGLQMAREAK